jgi:hypothetical protein
VKGLISGRWLIANFFFVMAFFLVFSAILRPVRHQMASIHSLFWTFTLPWTEAGCAVFSAGAWLILYVAAKRRRAKTQ